MYINKAIVGVAIGASIFVVSCNTNNGWNESNYFYQASTLPYHTADFSKIQNKDFKPALLEGMRQQVEAINKITSNKETPTFENTMVPLELSDTLLTRVQNVFSLLTGANTNDELIKINTELAPKFAAHSDAIYLNDALFQRVKTIFDNKGGLGLMDDQLRLLEVYYQNFIQAGANLSVEDKEKLKTINQDLAKLTNEFSDKLLAATKSGAPTFTKAQLEGISDDDLLALKQGDDSYVIPLNNTTQQPDLANLNNKETRNTLFKAAWTRAERNDKNDTRETILALVKKRAEKAKLLGFENFAAWSLQGTMAETPKNAMRILTELSPFATTAANEEAKEIQALIDQEANPFILSAADWDFYAEKIREQKYAINQNELKPYFEVEKVLKDGVFYMAKILYGISYIERTDLPVWHEDVKVYEFFNQDGSKLGLFYTDFFQRDSKRGGAWMSNIVNQSYLTEQLPVVYNVANFQKGAEGQPNLLTLDNVITMFHEFGHALHGLFADQKYPTLSGTNVARDFVEFPSQFHEHFAFDPIILSNYAKHYQTGYVMPEGYIEKIKNASNFNKGYGLTELLAASILDMAWHTIDVDANITSVDEFEKEALQLHGIFLENVPPRYRSTYFSHIFGGGYAAGYYSYKWSEMLDFDTYDWLQTHGGLTRENGQILRDKVFSRGNTLPLDKLYRDFRGQEPTIEAMLKYSGFLN